MSISKTAFIFSMLLAVTFVVLIAAQDQLFKYWERDDARQQMAQEELEATERADRFDEKLLNRLASDSLDDPAIADLLRKHRIKVTLLAPNHAAPSPSPQPSTAPVTKP